MIERRKETVAVRLEKTLYDALFANVPKGRTASSVIRELIVKHLLNLHALDQHQIARLAGIHLAPPIIPTASYPAAQAHPRLTAMEFPICDTCSAADNVFECPLCDTPTCRDCLYTIRSADGTERCYHEDRTTLSRTSSAGWG